MSIINVNNYSSPEVACAALNDGDSLYFPAGIHTLSADLAVPMFSVMYGCLVPTAKNITIYGDGKDNSTIYFPYYSTFILLCLKNVPNGDVTVHDVKFKCLASNHTYQGPAAISLGEHGATVDSGRLQDVTIYNCDFENVAFAVHGCGCVNLSIHDNTGNLQGGLAYPGSFSEVFTLEGAHNNDTTNVNNLEYVEIYNNVINPDPIYGDHLLYTLSEIEDIRIYGNTVGACKNSIYKFYNTAIADSGYTINSILIENENVGDADTEGVIVFSGTGKANSCIIKNIVAGNTDYFCYSEWGFGLYDLDGVYMPTCELGFHYMQKNNVLPVQGQFRLKNVYTTFGNTQLSVGIDLAPFDKIYVDNSVLNAFNSVGYVNSFSNASYILMSKIKSNLYEEDEDMSIDRAQIARTPCNHFQVVVDDDTVAASLGVTKNQKYYSYAYEMIDASERIYIILDSGAPQVLMPQAGATAGHIIITIVPPSVVS